MPIEDKIDGSRRSMLKCLGLAPLALALAGFSPALPDSYKIGDTVVRIESKRYPGRYKILYFNIHEDETTAYKAAHSVADAYGGRVSGIKCQGSRHITFRLDGRIYCFDTNRIFTDAGIAKTLKSLGNYSLKAYDEVKRFSSWLLSSHILNGNGLVMTVHNSGMGDASVNKYAQSRFISESHVNIDHSKFDFFYVTSKEYFDCLKDDNFNVVLQDNLNVADDGSLSVYCGRNNIPYINCEAKRGNLYEQKKMIEHACMAYIESAERREREDA